MGFLNKKYMLKTISKKLLVKIYVKQIFFSLIFHLYLINTKTMINFSSDIFCHYKESTLSTKIPSLMSLTIKLPLLKKGYTLQAPLNKSSLPFLGLS